MSKQRFPTNAPTFADEEKGEVHAVIETPSGCRTKYAWDPALAMFAVSKVLPLGSTFPYDFGFIAGTQAADGDPLDVLVLADEPLVVGCLVRCRVLGAVACSTSEKGEAAEVRNDRLIAVPTSSIVGSEWREMADVGDRLVREIAEFLESYTKREGRRFTLQGVLDRAAALGLLRAAM